MNRHSNTGLVIAIAAVQFGCAPSGPGDSASTESLSMMDDDAVPADYSFRRIQEQPTFPVDEQGRSFAALADRDEYSLSLVGDEPIAIEESR